MQIELWGIEFNKRKNSTKIPTTQGVIKEVVLKEHCTTMSPSFFVTGAVGYSYLKAWDNYYWITNIGFDINGHEYIDCQIDVLASWRSVIQSSTFYIERCADDRYYNTDIYDSAISVEDGSEVSSNALTTIFSDIGPTILLTLMGAGDTGLRTFVFSWGEIGFIGDLFNNILELNTNNTNTYLDLIPTAADNIVNGLIAGIKSMICDPSKYVLSCKFSPLSKSFYHGDNKNIFVGWFNTGVSHKCVDYAFYTKQFTLNKPASIYTDFRRTDGRCSAYTLYLPGVGTVDLSPDIIEMDLVLDLTLNQQTGDIHYILIADGAGIATYDGCIYSDYGFAATGSRGSISQTATGLAVTGSNLPYKDYLADESNLYYWKEGNPYFALAGLITTIKGIGEGLKPQVSLASPLGGSPAIVGDAAARITCVQKHTGDFLTNDFGRPCCKNLQLGTLTGFVQCANASIDISAIRSVRDEINTFLNTGFFME